jgi:hypothetical protein
MNIGYPAGAVIFRHRKLKNRSLTAHQERLY